MGEGLHFLPDIERELAGLIPSYDLEISVHTPLSDVNIGSLNPRMREAALNEVVRSIASAGRLGLGPFTVHPGFYSPLGQVDRKAAVEATKASLRSIEKTSTENGVTVALENMPDMPISMATSPRQLLELLEGTDLKICLDIGHAHTTKNIPGFLELKQRFVNIHIHDNLGHSDQHLPIGDGAIDFKTVLPQLRSYNGRYVIEARNIEQGLISRPRLEKLLDGH